MSASSYPWNIRIDVGGITFEGPGAENEMIADGLAAKVEAEDGVQNVEVFRQ